MSTAIREALARLVALEDERIRLRMLHESGFGTDYDSYHKGVPDAWHAARTALSAQAQQAQPFAWATFDGEGNYDFRAYEGNETYRDDWLKRNPKHKGWVIALYDHGAAQPGVSEASRFAGLLFDFGGFLTTRDERLIASSHDEAGPMVEAIQQFATERGLSLEPCDVKDWHAALAAQAGKVNHG